MNCCLEIVPVRRRISNPNVLSCEVISSLVSQKGPKCRQNGPGSLGGIFFIIPEITSSAKRGQVLDQRVIHGVSARWDPLSSIIMKSRQGMLSVGSDFLLCSWLAVGYHTKCPAILWWPCSTAALILQGFHEIQGHGPTYLKGNNWWIRSGVREELSLRVALSAVLFYTCNCVWSYLQQSILRYPRKGCCTGICDGLWSAAWCYRQAQSSCPISSCCAAIARSKKCTFLKGFYSLKEEKKI